MGLGRDGRLREWVSGAVSGGAGGGGPRGCVGLGLDGRPHEWVGGGAAWVGEPGAAGGPRCWGAFALGPVGVSESPPAVGPVAGLWGRLSGRGAGWAREVGAGLRGGRVGESVPRGAVDVRQTGGTAEPVRRAATT
ncbi:hypothetical protein GCM10010245_29270 [Streptomyces spectabilis]|nr:hypothetical protein GCM10010245_29270 [Streptomyces spectabilis]